MSLGLPRASKIVSLVDGTKGIKRRIQSFQHVARQESAGARSKAQGSSAHLHVLVLDVLQVRLDQGQVVALLEHVDCARVVDARDKHGKELAQLHGRVVEVELHGAVVDLRVAALADNVLYIGRKRVGGAYGHWSATSRWA